MSWHPTSVPWSKVPVTEHPTRLHLTAALDGILPFHACDGRKVVLHLVPPPPGLISFATITYSLQSVVVLVQLHMQHATRAGLPVCPSPPVSDLIPPSFFATHEVILSPYTHKLSTPLCLIMELPALFTPPSPCTSSPLEL